MAQHELLTTYLTTEDAAAYIGKSHRTLETWRSQGKGPAYYQLGAFNLGRRSVGYLQEDLDTWMAAEMVFTRVEP